MNITKEVYNYFLNMFLAERSGLIYKKLRAKKQLQELVEEQKITKKKIAEIDKWLRKMKYDFAQKKELSLIREKQRL